MVIYFQIDLTTATFPEFDLDISLSISSTTSKKIAPQRIASENGVRYK